MQRLPQARLAPDAMHCQPTQDQVSNSSLGSVLCFVSSAQVHRHKSCCWFCAKICDLDLSCQCTDPTSSLARRNMMCRMPASCRSLLLACSPPLRFLLRPSADLLTYSAESQHCSCHSQDSAHDLFKRPSACRNSDGCSQLRTMPKNSNASRQ